MPGHCELRAEASETNRSPSSRASRDALWKICVFISPMIRVRSSGRPFSMTNWMTEAENGRRQLCEMCAYGDAE